MPEVAIGVAVAVAAAEEAGGEESGGAQGCSTNNNHRPEGQRRITRKTIFSATETGEMFVVKDGEIMPPVPPVSRSLNRSASATTWVSQFKTTETSCGHDHLQHVKRSRVKKR